MTTLATIGYGPLAPVTVKGRLMVIWYSILGIPLMITFLSRIGMHLDDALYWLWSKTFVRCMTKRREKNPRRSDDDETDDDDEYYDGSYPFTLVMFLVLVFFVVFTVLVMAMEKGWTWFDAVYFIVTTALTIGLWGPIPGIKVKI